MTIECYNNMGNGNTEVLVATLHGVYIRNEYFIDFLLWGIVSVSYTARDQPTCIL
jgi:hypothetical protein